jgi:hypothetical protein
VGFSFEIQAVTKINMGNIKLPITPISKENKNKQKHK